MLEVLPAIWAVLTPIFGLTGAVLERGHPACTPVLCPGADWRGSPALLGEAHVATPPPSLATRRG